MDKPIFITPEFAVTSALAPEDFAAAAAMGFRSVLSNRPDGEAEGQLTGRAEAVLAWQAGLQFRHVPASPTARADCAQPSPGRPQARGAAMSTASCRPSKKPASISNSCAMTSKPRPTAPAGSDRARPRSIAARPRSSRQRQRRSPRHLSIGASLTRCTYSPRHDLSSIHMGSNCSNGRDFIQRRTRGLQSVGPGSCARAPARGRQLRRAMDQDGRRARRYAQAHRA
ncbi:MAG: hypothetical protein J0I75_19605 [Hyphomicrobium sp.]|nr:hypothetical protein [Hyphomicrobium sp.]